MKLKKQLKLILDAKGWTASELSRRSGVSKQSLSLWLGGSTPKRLEDLKKVADALTVTVDHLLFGVEDRPTTDPQSYEGLLEDENGWLSGFFEVKIRRVARKKETQ